MQNTLTLSPIDTVTGTGIICVDQELGDGFCDDENNNKDCNYDNGDCCDSTNTNPDKFQYCGVCKDRETGKCLQELYQGREVPECQYQFIRDNVCNVVNDNAYCYYDGGDCDQSDSIKTESEFGKICISILEKGQEKI